MLRVLCVGYGIVFAVAAYQPHDRSDWLLENLLVFAILGVLFFTRRVLRFSNFSYLLIFVFLGLHAVGAHDTYSLTPAGFWLQEAFGLARNPYDRLVHFAFGLLITYPLREVAQRVLRLGDPWSFVVPVLAVLATSASYEIIESWTARVVDPQLGLAFVGAQGDPWDAQKDMNLALGGSLACVIATLAYRRWRGREPSQLFAGSAE